MRKISGTILLLFLSFSLNAQEHKVNEIPIVKPKLFEHAEQKIKYGFHRNYLFRGCVTPITQQDDGHTIWGMTELTDCWWFQDCNNRDEK